MSGLVSDVWFKGYHAVMVMAHGGLVSKQLTQQQHWAELSVNTNWFQTTTRWWSHSLNQVEGTKAVMDSFICNWIAWILSSWLKWMAFLENFLVILSLKIIAPQILDFWGWNQCRYLIVLKKSDKCETNIVDRRRKEICNGVTVCKLPQTYLISKLQILLDSQYICTANFSVVCVQTKAWLNLFVKKTFKLSCNRLFEVVHLLL